MKKLWKRHGFLDNEHQIASVAEEHYNWLCNRCIMLELSSSQGEAIQ
jgi:predicted CoA-binding protein